ncbi:beta-carotene 15,15'-monooxygenase [Chryseobacterium indologenes]|uniref:beta-carotene 15,15'-monooxygenase n=1 Tax=Chryseobacterium TaxID=59732 RepID=UPI001629D02E|nr:MULTISPECIES: beta-carotene 15,15'-monooxygenase [Chryseobacterium]MDM1554112.1 beta-carotene 15,15'-monooxygenase [Chryseobacterium indologenes]WET47899.1 beta-carotene 15,15'-monooxygenase [Chryseobacterium indologenes]
MSEFNEFDQQGSVPNRETGSIISHAFEMYKGVFGYAIVAMIIYIVGGIIIQSLTGFNSAAIMEEMKTSGDYANFRYWETPGFSMYMTFSSLFLLLLTPLYVGLIYMVNKFNTKNPIEFSDLFIGYRQNFVNILIYSFISGIISSVALTLCFLPFIFIYPFLLLGYPILLFENSSAIDALSKSFNIAKENYGTFLGVSFLGLLISLAGIILCGIGFILTAPFIMIVMYSTYCAFVGKPRQIMYTK